MSEETKIEYCFNCNAELFGPYCSSCGYPQQLQRIDREYLLSEIGSVIHFDKGILYTIKELLLRPGVNVRKFIKEDRNRLVKPIIFIIVTSLIYTLAQQLLRFEDGYVNTSLPEDSAVTAIFTWIPQNYGYANIIMALFIALWIKLFFRKYNYNFFEILILLCFIMGIGMLIYTVFGIIEVSTEFKLLQIGGMIAFFYTSWAIGRFFDKKKKVNYLKGFLSYLLGMISAVFTAIALGMILDAIAM